MAVLTTPQLQTLKAHIAASSDMNSQPNNADGDVAIVALLNAVAAPTYWVVKTAVTQMDMQSKPSVDGTTFDWAQAGGFIARSQGERDAWRTIFQPGSVNPSFATVRAAFDDIFNGTSAGAQACRVHWRAVSRRVATRFERLYVLATSPAFGVGSTNPPGQNAGNRGETTHPDTLALGADGNFITSPVTQLQVRQARELV